MSKFTIRNGRGLIQKLFVRLLLLFRNSSLRQSYTTKDIYIEHSAIRDLKTFRELLIAFDLADYRVCLRGEFTRSMINLAGLLEWHHNLRFVWFDTGENASIRCIDHRMSNSQRNLAIYKQLSIHHDYRPNLTPGKGHYMMPFPMHPQLYVQYYEHNNLHVYRSQPRKIRILFAGNWNATGYNNPILGELFNKQTRYQIISYIEKQKFTRLIKTKEQLNELLTDSRYCNEVVVIDPSVRIDQGSWLRTIAQADFFLCPPGIIFPWSHNSVEAMAVGTIPLINYPEWFYPSLSEEHNCLTFSTLEHLTQQILKIQQMSREQIEILRNNVLEYYEHHLELGRFITQMINEPIESIHLHLWHENEALLRHLVESTARS